MIYTMQIIKDDKPIILNKLLKYLKNRKIEITMVQNNHVSFNKYYMAYLELFPTATDVTNAWKNDIMEWSFRGL